METKPLTTFEIAQYCRVTHRAVLKWITAGKLKAYRTPGKHCRVNTEDFLSFLQYYNMPIPETFQRLLRPNKRILIVDDDKAMVKTISKILSNGDKFDLKVAYDGFSAGLMFAQFKPDLVTLDISMPHLNGYEVCSLIRSYADKEEVKIIAVSAFADKGAIERITRLGANDYLVKPFSSKELTEKVKVHVS